MGINTDARFRNETVIDIEDIANGELWLLTKLESTQKWGLPILM
jgi:hypothetical protein